MSEPLPGFEERRLRASYDRQAMLVTLGAQLAEISRGRAALEMPSDPRSTQHVGYTHAGAVTTLVDTARGYAALSTMGADHEVLTVDVTADVVAPAAGARFRVTATVLRAGRTIVVTRGDVHALDDAGGEKLVAAMQATMMAVAPPPSPPVEPVG